MEKEQEMIECHNHRDMGLEVVDMVVVVVSLVLSLYMFEYYECILNV